MVFGRGAERASRVGAAVLRHGRRAVLIGGFLVAAWAVGASAAGAEETEGSGSLTLPVTDAVEAAEQAERTLERTTQGATALVTDTVAPATEDAPGVQDVLDPVLADVDGVTGAAGELPVIEPVSDSLGTAQPADEEPRTADAPARSDDEPQESAREDASSQTPSAKDRGRASEEPGPDTAGEDTASPTAVDPPAASDAAAQGETVALGGVSGTAVIGSGASSGSAFADQVRAPGLPGDDAESVVRPTRGIASAHTEAVEPSVSPD